MSRSKVRQSRRLPTKRELSRIEKYPDSYAWELAESFRERSDQSSNYLRALLLAITSGSSAFLITNHYKSDTFTPHWISIALLIAAIGLLIWSWDRQKTKSIRRLLKLRDEGYKAYLDYEEELAATYRNETIDRNAYIAIAGAVALEFGIKFVKLIPVTP